MATLSENLLALNEAKQAIKTAIENKGQNLTDVPFSQYAEKIDAIQGGGGEDLGLQQLTKAIIEKTIVEVLPEDVSKLGISRLGPDIFRRCATLKRFISTESQNIRVANNCFDGCGNLLEAHIGGVQSASGVFTSCSKLQKVKLLTDYGFPWGTFIYCSSLKVVDCRNAMSVPSIGGTAQVFQGVPDGCQIVVPDNLYDAWSTATNWVAYDNLVFVKASDYIEYEVIE